MPTDTAAAAPTPAPRTSVRDWLGRDPTVTMLGGLILLAAIFFGARDPSRFLSRETLRAMAFQMPELGILALAMMIPLMSGGLNLAIIATANLSALVMAALLTRMLGPTSPPQAVAGVIALALTAGLVAALLIGLITGWIVAFLGVHPILVTLGTMTAVKGLAVYATNGGVIGGFPPAILFLGNGTVLGVPVPMLLFVLCALGVAVLMTHTPFGVAVRLIGSNEKATRYSGVATHWVLGLFLSLILLQIISTGFNLLGFSPHLTEAIWGATMILAIALALVRDRWVARLWLRRRQRGAVATRRQALSPPAPTQMSSRAHAHHEASR